MANIPFLILRNLRPPRSAAPRGQRGGTASRPPVGALAALYPAPPVLVRGPSFLLRSGCRNAGSRSPSHNTLGGDVTFCDWCTELRSESCRAHVAQQKTHDLADCQTWQTADNTTESPKTYINDPRPPQTCSTFTEFGATQKENKAYPTSPPTLRGEI